ncbi:MAG: arylsulfatase, partial [Planctomycetes bacterium]|nr:arylsulfatase [Planctomycetota bacterium]
EATGQLFDLAKDPGETKNLFFEEVGKRQELQALLARLTAKEGGRTAPVERVPLGIERIPRRN